MYIFPHLDIMEPGLHNLTLSQIMSRAVRQQVIWRHAWHQGTNYYVCTQKSISLRIGLFIIITHHGHYNDVIMSAMTSQITGNSIVCSTVCFNAHQRKYESSASLAFVRGIYRWPVDSSQKGPVMRKLFPFDDVIMQNADMEHGTKFFESPLMTWRWHNGQMF